MSEDKSGKQEDKSVLDANTPREALQEIKKETKKAIKALDESTTIDERTVNIVKDILKGIKNIASDIKEDVTEKVE